MLHSALLPHRSPCSRFFFFNDTATTEIYTLSLHDALPILNDVAEQNAECGSRKHSGVNNVRGKLKREDRSEEHTSELQSLRHLVCRLLLEKKKTVIILLVDSYRTLYRSTDHASRCSVSCLA